MQSIINELHNFFSVELTVILTAMLPVIELRGAIPVGISGIISDPCRCFGLYRKHDTRAVYPFTVRPVFAYLRETRTFKRIVHGLTDRSMAKSGKIQKYGVWGCWCSWQYHCPGRCGGQPYCCAADMRIKWAFPLYL